MVVDGWRFTCGLPGWPGLVCRTRSRGRTASISGSWMRCSSPVPRGGDRAQTGPEEPRVADHARWQELVQSRAGAKSAARSHALRPPGAPKPLSGEQFSVRLKARVSLRSGFFTASTRCRGRAERLRTHGERRPHAAAPAGASARPNPESPFAGWTDCAWSRGLADWVERGRQEPEAADPPSRRHRVQAHMDCRGVRFRRIGGGRTRRWVMPTPTSSSGFLPGVRSYRDGRSARRLAWNGLGARRC